MEICYIDANHSFSSPIPHAFTLPHSPTLDLVTSTLFLLAAQYTTVLGTNKN